MIVRTFMPRMAPLVESGQKHQTVRKRPKRMPKVGELFSGRAWTGKPYRSKQRELVCSYVKEVADIEIGINHLDSAVWSAERYGLGGFEREQRAEQRKAQQLAICQQKA